MVNGVPSSQNSVETPEERQTARKAPRKRWQEGSQESARMAPGDQQDIERPLASKERLAVRGARLKSVLNSLQVSPISVTIGKRRVVVRVLVSRESGQQTGGRQVGIREVANEPELRRNARRTLSG